MSALLQKLLDVSACLVNQLGCVRPSPEHSSREFRRQYRICGEIGAGGFGRVYRAYRISDGLLVAVKHIRHKRVHDWTLLEGHMIPSEICYLQDCQDVKGVIRLVDWFYSRNGFLIVMERPENFMDLFDLVTAFGCLDERTARGIFAQTVATVVEMHAKHALIHRDIKDENIVVDTDTGGVWIVDFGAAKSLERARTQQFQGTKSYCPPEVLRRKCYFPLEGTVWSLGILLYTLVVGNPPFKDEVQICMGRLHLPRSLSSECASLIRRCLCLTPESRITLQELSSHEWLQPLTPKGGGEHLWPTVWRRARRRSHLFDADAGSSDDGEEEDCSYRTEPGAEPVPLTLPMIARATTYSTADFPSSINTGWSDINFAGEYSSLGSSLNSDGFETALESPSWEWEMVELESSFYENNTSDFGRSASRLLSSPDCPQFANPLVPQNSVANCFNGLVDKVESESSSMSSVSGRRDSLASSTSSSAYFSACSQSGLPTQFDSTVQNYFASGSECDYAEGEKEGEEEEEEDRTLRAENPKIILTRWDSDSSDECSEEEETIRADIVGKLVISPLSDEENK